MNSSFPSQLRHHLLCDAFPGTANPSFFKAPVARLLQHFTYQVIRNLFYFLNSSILTPGTLSCQLRYLISSPEAGTQKCSINIPSIACLDRPCGVEPEPNSGRFCSTRLRMPQRQGGKSSSISGSVPCLQSQRCEHSTSHPGLGSVPSSGDA